MNIATIVVLILFLVLVALVALYIWKKGPGCGCDCHHCGSDCHHGAGHSHKAGLLMAALLLSAAGYAQEANPNSRLVFHMKDGQTMRLAVDRVKEMFPAKYDANQQPTADYATWALTTTDGKAALLPFDEVDDILYIKGEPTDGALGATWYEIQRRWNEHAEVVMLNSINNYNNGQGVITQQYDQNWCGQREMYVVAFLATADLGYEVNFRVVGLESRTVYSDISGFVLWLAQNNPANQWGQACWAFPMPPETILIEATATENTEYESHPWLGNYYGHPVCMTEDFVYTGTQPELTRLSLKGNKSYIFSSTAEGLVSSNMTYEYTDRAFHWTQEETGDLSWRGDQVYYGMSGQWLNDTLIYLRANDINEDKPENVRRFFMLKNEHPDFRMTVGAKDNWGGRATEYLAELYYDGAAHYYFMNNYGAAIYEASVEFKSGSTIAEGCEAIVTWLDNQGLEQQFRYVTKDGKNPEFLPIENPGPDGPETAEWTGANLFQNEAATGVYDGHEYTSHKVYVRLDQDPNGGEKKGYCSVRVDMYKGAGSFDKYFISTSGQYAYNPKSHTITVSHVLLGVEGGGAQDYRDIVLRVSDDLKTLTFDPEGCGDKLYSSRTNSYILTGETNKLTAQ